MFEAVMEQGGLLKKIIEALKDMITDCNWDCNDGGVALQAMESSQVALVALLLRSDGFAPYRCDRNLTLGMNMVSLAKILKCADQNDKITISAEDKGDTLSFKFEGKNDRESAFDLKLMNIEMPQLMVPDDEYEAVVDMPAIEFQRICRDLTALGENVFMEVTKNEVKFSAEGEIGSGTITLKSTEVADDAEKLVSIQLTAPVSCTLALKYLQMFTKSTSLSKNVTISMKADNPVVFEYKLEEMGYLRFYLAPKIDGDD